MRFTRYIPQAILLALGLIVVGFVIQMAFNRVYVAEGQSLMLRYKGPLLLGTGKAAVPGQFAKQGEVGVREEMLGPGRHFYCPLWWECTLVDDTVVKPGEVAVVTSKMGDPLPAGEFLVDGGISGSNRAKHQGVLRKVLGPGRYRIHPYAFTAEIIQTKRDKVGLDVKYSGWVEVPTGYVGVVTDLAANKGAKRSPGIRKEVLQPGIYPVNPREQQIDVVEIGYREKSISVDKIMLPDGREKMDESGEAEPLPQSGIGFPSNDGFNIQIDFTAIWGVMPEDAAKVIETFGSAEAAEQKVIIPQSESICRNNGSKMGATELLVGETREKFQEAVSADFKSVLETKHLTLLYGLVRHIYIPKEVRVPLQKGYVADELTLTREEERTTKQAEGVLREAEKKVIQETEKVKVETAKLVAEAIAEGERQVGEIAAETKQKVAQVDKQVAELDAQKTELLGKAKATSEQLMKEAESQKFDLAVKAFGNASAYTRWQFAEGLPENMDLKLFYAGEGTLWTDLKNMLPTLPIAPPQGPQAGSPPKTSVPATKK
jgi:regulator of protease activity HflC (stomatin/prohibitin superfamily)